MDAYNELEINNLLDREGHSIIKLDDQIRARVNMILGTKIMELRQIIESEGNINEIIMQAEKKIDEIMKVLIANDLCKTSTEREKYDKTGKKDIEIYFQNVKTMLNNSVALVRNNRPATAFQILGVARRGNNIRTEQEQNANIAKRTLEYIKFTLKTFDIETIEGIETMVLNLSQYIWSYSNIKDSKSRNEYEERILRKKKEDEYKELREKGKTMAKSLGNPSVGELREKKSISFQNPEDKNYTKIDLVQIAILSVKAFFEEQYGAGYLVSKEKLDGTVIEKAIFSNIDMTRITWDENYKKQVEEYLLSDEAIEVGEKYFGGYVGEIDRSGSVKFDLGMIGLTDKWTQTVKKKRKNAKRKA